MRFALEKRGRVPGLSLTSMLDVIFLLLFYFAAMSVQSQWESDINIALPEARHAEDPQRLPGEIVANVHKDGSITVNNMVLTLADLERKLRDIAVIFPDQTVVIRAARDASCETLVKVLDTCRAAGVWNFSVATQNAGGDKGAHSP